MRNSKRGARTLLLCVMGFWSFIATSFVTATVAKAENTIVFTDFLFENWSNSGTSAQFDLDSAKDSVIDMCGTVQEWIPGRAYDNHKGWDRDIPNDYGKYVIFAAAPGKVIDTLTTCFENSQWCGGGTGNRVIIDHGFGVVTKYFHGDHGNILVQENQWVDHGTPLFIGDNTGDSTGAHSHFQVEINGVAVNPLGSNVFWKNTPVFNAGKCTFNPYTLLEYAKDRIQTIQNDYQETGFQGGEIQWMLNSGGSDQSDLVVSVSKNAAGEKAYTVFDLIGNAQTAIYLNHEVVKVWDANGGPEGNLGKPLTPMQFSKDAGQRVEFEKGFVVFLPIGADQVKTEFTSVSPGLFDDGFRKGKSYAIISAYLAYGGTENYHNPKMGKTVESLEFQEFESDDDAPGGTGIAAFMLKPWNDNFTAVLIRADIYKTYTKYGPGFFGYPIGPSFFDASVGSDRQYFSKGKSILATGIVVNQQTGCIDDTSPVTGNACSCPGMLKELPCTKCGTQEWKCINYEWQKFGSCGNQGMCEPGEKSTTFCVCGGTTQSVCTNSCTWGPTEPCAKKLSPEICDGKDNDCDGQVDEDQGFTQCGVGWCDHKHPNCLSGKPSVCDPFLDWQLEICDGEDNDCDNQTDEENVCCKPKSEVCNLKDDDCDGLIDEAMGKSDCGTGECAHIVWNCIEGTIQKCNPLKGAYPETCDGLDNDCDGVTDQGNICCKENLEICDGKDNDCDGQVDEDQGFTECGMGSCNHKHSKCISGKAQICDPFLGWQPEVCNLKDDDCNGIIDEGLGKSDCGLGVCTHITWNCIDGAPQKCDPLKGAIIEICDGKDNDCDGMTDEGNVCCTLNACNGCKKLDHALNDTCGSNGKYVCDGKDTLKCQEAPVSPPPADPPPSNPPPPPPPPSDPPPSPPPPQPNKNACGGTSSLSATPGTKCGNACGTWTCSGNDSVICANEGVCSPGEQTQDACSLLDQCGPGSKSKTCSNTCQWTTGTCIFTKSYGFSTSPSCGDVMCLTIQDCSANSCTAIITKNGGAAFSSNPTEWRLEDTNGKIFKIAPGSGCGAYYGGQTSFSFTFTPPASTATLQFKIWSGGTTCNMLYTSGTVTLKKCQ